MTFDEIAAIYRAALPPDGHFFQFPTTALDHTGVPAWSNVYLPGPLGGGDGYGATDIEAQVGTLGELHERVQSRWVVPTLPTERGSYADMVVAHGEAAVLDPVLVGLPAGSAYRADLPRLWVTMQRYPRGEQLVLLEAAASSASELPTDYEPLFLPVSNGLGAGLDRDRALNHALFEILQRDGNSVTYRALDRGRVVDVSDVPAETAGILAGLAEAGVQVNVKLAATDFGLVNLYVNGYGPDDDHPQIKLAAGGEACALDRAAALRKAVLEFAFSRARLAFGHGDLSLVERVAPPDYVETYRSFWRVDNEEPRALQSMLNWVKLSPAQLKAKLSPIYHERERIDWATLPSQPELAQAAPGAQLSEVAERLGDLEILYNDMATPRARDHGVHAVKAIVPTLEVETASYARIGERNLRRLLERDSPLVKIGDNGGEGWRKIHLTQAASERIGGRAWLDVETLNGRVDDLYSLYREPSHHAAAFVRAGLA